MQSKSQIRIESGLIRTGTRGSSSCALRLLSTQRPDTFWQAVLVGTDSSCSSAADHTIIPITLTDPQFPYKRKARLSDRERALFYGRLNFCGCSGHPKPQN